MNIEWKISRTPEAYEDAVAFMERRVQEIIEGRNGELVWLLEHPPLYTAGTSARKSDLLDPSRFPVYRTGRGGQYTYHGPGQRVAYVLLDLRSRTKDVRQYVHNLERWVVDALAWFDVRGEIRDGRVGVWVRPENDIEAKIAALGVRIKQWVTCHGIAVNVNPDLGHYKGIIPCGIKEYSITSLHQLGVDISMDKFDEQLIKSFHAIF